MMPDLTGITKQHEWQTQMTSFARTALYSGVRAPLHILRSIHHLATVARSRRALRRLDPHLLRDIGLTHHEAEVEADRAPWDAPLHWRS